MMTIRSARSVWIAIALLAGFPAFSQGPESGDSTDSSASGSKTPVVDDLTIASNSWKDKKFTGSPISLNLKDADLLDVFRLIGETSGFNVVVHPSVSGRITLSLEQVPWDQALEVVLSTFRLGADRSQSILRIMPREMLFAEAQAALDAKKTADKLAPRYTRIFPISYVEITQMQALLKRYFDMDGATAGGGPNPISAAAGPSIIPDPNTQSLIVRDTTEGLEKITKLIRLLDVQNPQIVIDAKVIDATENFSKAINGRIAFGDKFKGAYINGADLTTVGGQVTNKGDVNTLIFSVLGTASLSAVLTYAESENSAKVIASPRLLVLSGKSATINQSTAIAIKTAVAAGGVTTVADSFQQVPTTLTVTPRATNEGSVFMKLSLQRQVTQQVGEVLVPADRSINTDVIVDSGNTLVLGGVQSSEQTEGSSGIPFIRKIPIIGWLFGSERLGRLKTELMFFVTPRILNMRRSGIVASSASGAGTSPAADTLLPAEPATESSAE